jgi:hypothetical protein
MDKITIKIGLSAISVEELIERHTKKADEMAQSAQKCADIQREMSAKLKKAVAEGDKQAANEAEIPCGRQ